MTALVTSSNLLLAQSVRTVHYKIVLNVHLVVLMAVINACQVMSLTQRLVNALIVMTISSIIYVLVAHLKMLKIVQRNVKSVQIDID